MDKNLKGGKKKQKTVPEVGVAHIRATFNNTIVTISDMSGNGPVRVLRALRVQEKVLHLPHRWQQIRQLLKHGIWV